MTHPTGTTASVDFSTSNEPSSKFKRRFMVRLVAVFIGGMFLDGYILGIIGPVTVPTPAFLQLDERIFGHDRCGPAGWYLRRLPAGWVGY